MEWRVSQRVSLLIEPRDLWVGLYWRRTTRGMTFYVGGPVLVMRVDSTLFPRRAKEEKDR
jgi:hypothetical protein